MQNEKQQQENEVLIWEAPRLIKLDTEKTESGSSTAGPEGIHHHGTSIYIQS